MIKHPVVVGLPIADRPASFDFYRNGLGFEAIGEPAEDGVPEPLQFALNDGLRLMLIPTGGFGWTIGGRAVAAAATSECVLTLGVDTPAEVDAFLDRAAAAGAEVIMPAGEQPWGYVGTFADPDGHVIMVRAADST